jgi:hypothetical protein
MVMTPVSSAPAKEGGLGLAPAAISSWTGIPAVEGHYPAKRALDVIRLIEIGGDGKELRLAQFAHQVVGESGTIIGRIGVVGIDFNLGGGVGLADEIIRGCARSPVPDDDMTRHAVTSSGRIQVSPLFYYKSQRKSTVGKPLSKRMVYRIPSRFLIHLFVCGRMSVLTGITW